MPKFEDFIMILLCFSTTSFYSSKFEDIFSQLNSAKHLFRLCIITYPSKKSQSPKQPLYLPLENMSTLMVLLDWHKHQAYFQELMNKIPNDLPFTIAHLDDISCYSKNVEEHLDHLQQVFQNFCDVELPMKLSKCHLFTKEIQYFGHVLSTTGIKPLSTKTTAIKTDATFKNVKQVRAFLALVGYYHKFIKNFAQIAKPLTTLTHHDAKFDLTPGHHAPFSTLKSILIEARILHYPDPSKCYIVYADASDDACVGQWLQEHDGKELPVAFLSNIH